jgi:putative sigma-54 modulation protein
MIDINVSFVGMEPTEALKKFVIEKIGKHENLLKDATKIEVFLKENQYRRGKDNDFRIDINVYLPNSQVRVEVVGEDMYANIDEATDILARRVKRYLDKREQWEGKIPWKVLEADVALENMEEDIEDDEYIDYTPEITRRRILEDMSPTEEGEAIEKMELSGYDQILFRSKSTGKISMIYRRLDGTYGLVEPADTV